MSHLPPGGFSITKMEHQRRPLSKENTIEPKHKSVRFSSFKLLKYSFVTTVLYYNTYTKITIIFREDRSK